MTQHSTGRITRRSALAAGAALGAGALGASQAMAAAPGLRHQSRQIPGWAPRPSR